jgi:hypothetical protein
MKTVGASAERWSILGGAYKRLARISSEQEPEVCNKALKEMESAYEKAWELAIPRKKGYPLTNHLAARIARLLRASQPDHKKAVPAALEKRATEATSLAETERQKARDDFWAGIGFADAKLIGDLVRSLRSPSKTLSEAEVSELIDEYTNTWRRYGSARELNSVIEHYAFLAAVLKGQKLSEQFEKIQSSLQSVAGH